MSIRTKLILGFLAVLLPVFILGVSGIVVLSDARQEVATFNEDIVAKIAFFARFKDTMHMSVIGVYEYVQTGNEDAKARTNMLLKEAHKAKDNFVTLTHHDDHEETREEELAGRLEILFANVDREIRELIRIFESEEPSQEEILAQVRTVRAAQMEAMETSHGNIDTFLLEKRTDMVANMGDLFDRSRNVLMLLVLASLGAGLLVAIIFSHRLSSALRKVRNAAQQITKGNFAVHLTPHSKDEMGELMLSVNKMRDGLKAIMDAKNDFVSVASHQLRTPVTVIAGNAEFLLGGGAGELNTEQKTLLQNMEKGITRMNRVISDLLAMARLEAQTISGDAETIRAGDLCKTIRETLGQKARTKNVNLEFECADVTLHANAPQLHQALQNLVDNAIEYSGFRNERPPKVSIQVKQQGENVAITVADNGIGIPKEEQDEIFTRFYRATNAKRAASDGSGLGLAIAKKIIEQNHGHISFKSTEGEGTTFFITLPSEEHSG